MSTLNKGDRVLVTLSGIEVPATVVRPESRYVVVTWLDHVNENYVLATQVRPDPAFAPTAKVGDVLNTPSQLRELTTQRLVLVDGAHVAGTWNGKIIAWAIEDNSACMSGISSVIFPAQVVAVLP
jgi:hypothetical protein